MNKNDDARIFAAQSRHARDFHLSPVILPGIMRLVDLIAIAAAAALAIAVFDDARAAIEQHAIYAGIIGLLYVVNASAANLYEVGVISRPLSNGDAVILALVKAIALFLGVAFGLGVWSRFEYGWVAAFGGISVALLIAARMAAWTACKALATRGVMGRSMAVLGAGEQGRRFLRRMCTARPYFFRVAGIYESRPGEGGESGEIEGQPVLGGVDELLAHVRARRLDDVVVALPWNAGAHVSEAVERLKELPVNVHLSADLVGYDLAFRPALGDYRELPLFEVVQRPISGWSAALKATEDYVISAVVLILLAPMMLMIAAAIKLDSPGPVFFMQERLGFNNQIFRIYKFRSMYHSGTPETVVKQAQRGDPRVTRVGRFIRATSLDELPQLLNVLDGTMSLVGPRPHALSHNAEYGARIRGYFARHRVKPGITGWAQVNGLRGETEALEQMEARIRHDIYYADNWSLLFDLRILFLTALVVPFQKSAY